MVQRLTAWLVFRVFCRSSARPCSTSSSSAPSALAMMCVFASSAVGFRFHSITNKAMRVYRVKPAVRRYDLPWAVQCGLFYSRFHAEQYACQAPGSEVEMCEVYVEPCAHPVGCPVGFHCLRHPDCRGLANHKWLA